MTEREHVFLMNFLKEEVHSFQEHQTDEFVLRWSEHSPQLVSQVSSLTILIVNKPVWFQFCKMMTEESFTDVIIATEKNIFKVFNDMWKINSRFQVFFQAHKLVLSACSPFFHYLISSSSSNNDLVIIINVTFKCVKKFID